MDLENNNLPDIECDLSPKESVGKFTSRITKASSRMALKKVAARSLRSNAVDGMISGDKIQPDSSKDIKKEPVKEDLASADSPEALNLKLSESDELSCQPTGKKFSEMANETLIKKASKYLFINDHHVSTKAKNKETLLPRRPSKRLADIDPGPAGALELSDRSLRKRVRCAVASRRNLSEQESKYVDQMFYKCNSEIIQLSQARHSPGQIEEITD